MKYVIVFVVICLFLTGCWVPEQPEVSSIEKIYIQSLESKCSCKVTREIDSDYLYGDKAKSGYLLHLEDLSCEYIDTANLELYGKKISRDFYLNVLKSDTIYETMTIMFSCSKLKDQYHGKSFDYKCKELP
jgi:hypothetical protein